MKIIIPIAGEGKRLRPHTHTKPKPLMPIAGKPMIDHIMDKMLMLEPSEIVFITGHLRLHLEEHLQTKYGATHALRFVEQKILNGTAGAVFLAHDAFDEDILIDFGDTIFDADLSIIKNSSDDAIIWTMEVEDYQRFGVIVTNNDGYATKMVEKPITPVSKLANIGLYYVKNTKLLSQGIQHVLAHQVQGKEAYLTDAFSYMIEKGAKIKIVSASAWYDCGTGAMVLETNRRLLENIAPHTTPQNGVTIIAPVVIDPTAVVENSVIGPYVSVSAGVEIKNSTIKNSIIDEKATIHYATLSDSIIGKEAKVTGDAKRVVIGDHSIVE